MKDISNVILNGDFTGTIATSSSGASQYLKDASVTVEVGGKAYSVPVRGFGSSIEGAESLLNQKALVEATYYMEPGRDANADKVFGNLQVVSIRSGSGESESSFRKTGYVTEIEEKGKIKVMKLEVSSEYWDSAARVRKPVSREVQIAFFSDNQDQLKDITRGQQVDVRGYIKTSGDKNYLDFIGEKVSVLGGEFEEEAVDL